MCRMLGVRIGPVCALQYKNQGARNADEAQIIIVNIKLIAPNLKYQW